MDSVTMDVDERDLAVVTITPLLQTEQHDQIRMARWGNENSWSSIPATWQPASDVEDEWQHVELTKRNV